MYKASVLIISTRKELAIKYKKLIEALKQDVFVSNDLSDALAVIQKQHVEFIIISDTIKEKLSDFIRKIRVLTYSSRPIIIAVSKSSDLEDRLEVLDVGADDFLGEEISKKEFQIRFKAHLRRYIESFINPITRLFDKNITIKTIKRTLEDDNSASYLLLKIKDIDLYRKTHGEIAYEKVLQTLSAIINSSLSDDDFAGHINDDELIIITNPMQAEKIASFLTFAFDNILNKFYSTTEYNNNFTIQSSDNIQEVRSNLMHLNIAVISKDNNIQNYIDILNELNELIKLCSSPDTSIYVIDRIRLNGVVTKQNKKNKVLILELDNSLSYLLKSVCELNNIQAEIAQNENDFINLYKTFKPDVVVMDWGEKKQSGFIKLAQKISKDNIKLIFSSSFLNKKEILKTGADLYMPKPYEINDMIGWIEKFLDN